MDRRLCNATEDEMILSCGNWDGRGSYKAHFYFFSYLPSSDHGLVTPRLLLLPPDTVQIIVNSVGDLELAAAAVGRSVMRWCDAMT